MAAVLVHIDLDDGRPDPSSLMALAAGRAVASSWGAVLYAVAIMQADGPLPGLDIAEALLARGGADKILVATTRTPVVPLWAALGGAWQGVLDQLRPRLVLFGADAPSAAELAPRTAARIGARLLVRARVQIDEVELRDRDGGHARSDDGGAAVVLVGHGGQMPRPRPSIDRIEVVVLPPIDGDLRLEVVAVTPADIAHAHGVVIAVGDEAARDVAIVADAKRLAELVGGELVGSAGAARSLAGAAAIDRSTPLAPELCVTIGDAKVDVAGATSVIKIGAPPSKLVDGALPGPVAAGLADLVARLERA